MEQILDILEREGDGRWFRAIHVDGYTLSIQGSETHYCTPKRLLPFGSGYSSLEVAVIVDGRFLNVAKSSVFRNFSRYEDLMEYILPSCRGIFAYLPVELLQDLYEYLKYREHE